MPAQDKTNTYYSQYNFDNADCLSVSEAASVLRISASTLRRLESEGKITSERMTNGYRCFKLSNILEYKNQADKVKQENKVQKTVVNETNKPAHVKPTIITKKEVELKNAQRAAKAYATVQKRVYKIAKFGTNFSAAALGLIAFFVIAKSASSVNYGHKINCILNNTYNVDKVGCVMGFSTQATNTTEKLAMETSTKILGSVLGDRSKNPNFLFTLNAPSIFKENITAEKDIDVAGIARLYGGLETNNQNGDFGTGTIIAGNLNFIGVRSINNLGAIDATTETTLEAALDINGDVVGTSLNNVKIARLGGIQLGDLKDNSDGNILMIQSGKVESVPQSEITEVGTIGAGTWEGDPIQTDFGGTGLTAYNTGDLLYGAGSNTLGALPIGPDGYVLTAQGGVPSWQALAGTGDITGVGNIATGAAFTGSDLANALTFEGNTVTQDANDTTVTAVNPAASVTYTLPDLGTNGTFAFLEGTQTFTGNKTFNGTSTFAGTSSFNGTTNFNNNVTFANVTLLDLSSVTHANATNQGLRLPVGNVLVNPTSGQGYMAFETSTNMVKIYDGNNWVSISGASTTLQQAYNAGNSINTTDGRNISILLQNTATDQTFEISQAGTADAFRVNDDGSFNDTTAFVIDAAGNVGIGTTTPGYKLEVNGSLNATSFYIGGAQITSTAAELNYLSGLPVTAGAVVYTNGTSLASTGTGASGFILQSNGAGAPTWVSASGAGINYWSRSSTTLSPVNPNDVMDITSSTGVPITLTNSGTGNSFVVNDVAADTTPFLVDANGNVGIGEATPNALLTVGNGDLFQVNSAGAIAAATGMTSSGTITFSSLTANQFVKTTAGGQLTTASDIALGTETTGDYVSNITGGNGIATTGATTGETISHTLSVDATTTGTTSTTSANSGIESTATGIRLLGGCANNEVLAWNASGATWGCSSVSGIGAGDITAVGDIASGSAFTGNGDGNTLTFEGTGADDLSNVIITALNPVATRTYTLPDLGTNGTFAFLEGTQTFLGDKTFSGSLTTTGSANINGQLNANGNILLGDATTDAVTFTGRIAQDSDIIPITTAGTSDLGSAALPWDNIFVNGISFNSTVITATGTEINLLSGRSGTLLDSVNVGTYATTAVTAGSGLTGGGTNGALTLDIGASNGINVNANDISVDATTTGTTSTTNSNSGIESTATGIRLLGGCADAQVLAWNTASAVWQCAAAGGAGDITTVGDVTSGSAFTGANDGNSLTFEGTVNDAFDITVNALATSASRTYSLPDLGTNGTFAFLEGTQTFSGDKTFSGSLTATGTISLGNGSNTVAVNSNTWDITTAGVASGFTGITSSGTITFSGLTANQFVKTTTGGQLTTASDVALGTETTGDYISNIVAGSGIATTGAATGETISHTLSVDATTTGTTSTTSANSGIESTATGIRLLGGCANNEVLAWNAGSAIWTCTSVSGIGAGDITAVGDVTSGSAFTGANDGNSLTFEGTVNDAFDITVNALSSSANRTYSLPDLGTNGTFAFLEGTQTFLGDKTFSGSFTTTGSANINGQLNANGNILLGDATTDAITFNGRIAQDSDIIPITTAGTSDLGSAALPWDNLFVNGINFNGTAITATGTEINLLSGRTGTLVDSNNVSTYATTAVTAGSGLTGGGTTGALTLDIGASNGITVNANDISVDATTTGTTATTSANSGIESTATGIRLLGGCANNEVLAWNSGTAVWACTSVGGIGAGDITAVGDVTTGSAFTGANDGNSLTFEGGTNDAFDVILTAASTSATRTYTLPDLGTNGTFAFLEGTQTFLGDKTFNGSLTTTGSANINGQLNANGNILLGDATTDSITFTARVAQDSDIIPITTAGTSDLGSAALPWDNLFVNGITFNGTTITATGTEINLLSGRTGTLLDSNNISTYATTAVTAGSGLTGGGTNGALTLDIGASNGITVNANDISVDATTTGTTATTSANSGIESTATGIRLLGGCANNEVLAWNSGTAVWACTSVGGIGAGDITAVGDVTSGSAFTGANDGNSLTFEGTVNDSNDVILTAAATSATRTYTLPDLGTNGTFAFLEGTQTFLGDKTFSGSFTTTGSANINGQLNANGNILLGDATTDAITVTARIAQDSDIIPITTAGTSDLGSAALPWDNLFVNGITFNGTAITATGTEINLLSGRTGTLLDSNNVSTYATTAVTAGSGLSGGGTVGALTLDIGGGNGITVNANDISVDATTTGTTSTTSANSGIESTATGIRLLGGCANNEVLAWNAGSAIWTCTSVSGIGAGDITAVGDVASGSAFTGANDGNSLTFEGTVNDAFDITVNALSSSANRTYSLPDLGTNGTFAFLEGTQTFLGDKTFSGSFTTTGSANINGQLNANGNILLGDATTDSITFTARVAQDSDIIPITTAGTSDLGSAALPWDNLFVNGINFNGTAITATGTEINLLSGRTGTLLDSNNVSTYATTAVTAGSGLTGGGTNGALTLDIGASNGITVNANDISVDATTTGTTSTTSANSGIESTATGIRLLGGCANNEVLAWNSGSAIWTCSSVSGIGAGDITAVGDVASGSAFTGANDGNSLTFEGTVNDSNDIILTAASTSATRTYTLPDLGTNGTFAFLEGTQTFTGDKTFSGLLTTTGTANINGQLNANGNILLGDATTDAITITGRIAQDSDIIPITTAGTSDLGSAALPWDNLFVNGINFNGTAITATGTEINLLSGRTGTLLDSNNISTYATTAVTAGSGLTGGGTTGALTLDIGASNGITVNANDISVDATTTGTTATTSANSGIESTATGIRLLGGCANNEVLAWNAGGATWGCTSVGSIGAGDITAVGDVATGSAFTGANDGNSLTFEGTVNDAFDIAVNALATSANRTYSLPDLGTNGTFAFLEGTQTFTGDKTFSGLLTTTGTANINGTLNIGDALSDVVTVSSGTWTFANDTNFALSGGTNGLSIDGSTFSIDASNDRIGIGNIAPAYTLDITGTARVSTNLGVMGANPTTNYGITTLVDANTERAISNSISLSASGASGYGLYNAINLTSAGGKNAYGVYNTFTQSGILGAAGTHTGMYNSASFNIGALSESTNVIGTDNAFSVGQTASPAGPVTIYGLRNTLTLTGSQGSASGFGTYNALTSSAAGATDTMYGTYTSLSTSANDTAYGEYITSTSAAGTQYGIYGTFSGAATRFGIYFEGEANNYFSGNVGIGTTSPNNKLEVSSTTTPQLRLAYDTSNYATQAVASNGATTFDATGAGAAFTFSDAVTTSSTLTSSGDFTANGNTTLGNAITDSITLTARIAQDSDIIPITTAGTSDLGSAALPWDNLFVNGITFNGTAITATGTEINLLSGRSGTLLDSINVGSYATTAVTAGSGLSGGGTTGALTLDIGASNGITVNANDISVDATTTGTTATTSANSGIESTATGIRLLGGCANDEVLSWDSAGAVWQCNSVSGIGGGDISAVGDQLSGTAFTGAGDGNTLTFEGAGVDDANNVIITALNPAATRTYTLPDLGTNGTFAFLEGTQTFLGDKTFSGSFTTTGTANINGTLNIGDASSDVVNVNSASWTFANDTNLVLSGGINGLSFDTDTLSIDAANNRIGIGNTTPTEALTVTGSGVFSGNIAVAGATTASSIGIRHGSVAGTSSAMGFQAGGTLVTTSGGASAGGMYVAPVFSPSNTLTNAYGVGIFGDSMGEIGSSSATNAYALYISAAPTFASNNFAIFSGSGTNYFAGNVGIGTSAPNNALEIVSTATIPQFRTAYDTSNYATQAVASNGATTFDATGAGAAFTFSDNVTASANLTTTGTATLNGVVNIGDAAGDAVAVSSGTWTFANDTNFVLSGGANGLSFDTSTLSIDATSNRIGIGTTAPSSVLDVVDATITTGNGISGAFNALTSGYGLNLASTSTALTTGRLASMDWSPSGTTQIYATGDIVNINIGQYGNVGNLINITDNGTTLFSVSESAITSALPHNFTAAGDVSMAYDLQFTNQTASYIKSKAPLYIEAGESFENNDLTLTTYGSGNIIANLGTTGAFIPSVDNSFDIGTTTNRWQDLRLSGTATIGGNVGIGTTSPTSLLELVGTGTSQIKVAYNSTNFATQTVASNGLTTFDATGTGAGFSFIDSVTAGSNLTLSASTGLLDLSAITHATNAISGLKLPQAASLGSGPSAGEGFIAYDTTANTPYVWNGTSWASIGGSSTTLQQAYDAGNTITGSTGRNISFTLADLATDQVFEVTQAGTANAFRVNDDGTFTDTTPFLIDASGNVGIGTTTPAAALDIVSTGTQIRAGYDGSNYTTMGVASNGATTFDATGAGAAFTFSDSVTMAANLTTSGTANINGSLNIGDAAGDIVNVSSGTWTFANDTNFTLSGGVNGLSFDGSTFSVDATSNRIGIGTTAPSSVLDVVDATITTGNGISGTFNALTSGYGLNITSTSNTLSTGRIASMDWSPSGSTQIYATGDIVNINIGQYGNVGNLFNITDTGSTLFAVSETAITSALPHSFTASGDVSMAYDLQFTNQTASYIKSNASLEIQAGETFESNNLTLTTYNAGNILNSLTGTGYFKVNSDATTVDGTTSTNDNVAGGFFSTNDLDTISLLVRNRNASAVAMTNVGTAGAQGDPGILTIEGTTSGTGYNLITAFNSNTRSDAAAVFRVRADGNIYGEAAFNATGADYAEYFEKEEEIAQGEMVGLNPTTGKVRKYRAGDQMMGVISEKPSVVGNYKSTMTEAELNAKYALVGLIGQIRLKITSENGEIKAGDAITYSSKFPGTGVKAIASGPMIGRALESYDSSNPNKINMVSVFIRPGWYTPESLALQLDDLGNIVSQFQNVDTVIGANVQQTAQEIVSGMNTSLDTKLAQVSARLDALESSQSTTTAQNNYDAKITTINDNLSLINDLLGINGTDQSTESTQSSGSSPYTGILDKIAAGLKEIKDFVNTMGLSKNGNTLAVNSDLNVLGAMTASDITITGDANFGLIKFDTLANTINMTGPACFNETTNNHNTTLCDTQTIFIQKNLAGNLDVFNGKIVFEPDGSLTVKGVIKADKYDVTTTGEKASAGKVTIPANTTTFVVTTKALTDNSLIMATPDTPVLIGSKKTSSDTFEITLGTASTKDVEVSWWIIN